MCPAFKGLISNGLNHLDRAVIACSECPSVVPVSTQKRCLSSHVVDNWTYVSATFFGTSLEYMGVAQATLSARVAHTARGATSRVAPALGCVAWGEELPNKKKSRLRGDIHHAAQGYVWVIW